MKGAIFDMDGLLTDTERMYQGYWRELAEERGLTLDADFLAAICGSSGEGTNAVLRRYYPGYDPDELHAACRKRMTAALERGVPLKPGVHTILEGLRKRGFRVAVASSSNMARVQQCLRGADILRYFDVVVSGAELEHGKPAPDIFLLAAEQLGLDARDCYVFEDSYNGIRAGYAAGCRSVMVPDLMPPTEEMRALSWRIFPDLAAAWAEIEKRELISRMKLYLFDMDGTLYLGNRLFPFTKELLAAIRASGARYLFMTNNSSKSVEDYVAKLAALGIEAAREDFITSSQATAYYLHRHHAGARLYVCGTESLKAEFRREGFAVTEDADAADCIVMGYDTELTYRKLLDVSRVLTERPEIPYIATNPDLVCPTEFGYVPDCGSVCEMIFNATGRRPTVIGKPSPLMPELAMERLGCGRNETCVVGDRIYTDVKSGLNAGITGILVMSGETTPETPAASEDRPNLVLRDAGEILEILRGGN